MAKPVYCMNVTYETSCAEKSRALAIKVRWYNKELTAPKKTSRNPQKISKSKRNRIGLIEKANGRFNYQRRETQEALLKTSRPKIHKRKNTRDLGKKNNTSL